VPFAAAYQGAPGAFSEEAARAMLGPDASLLPCRTLDDVAWSVVSGRAESAVVPVSNSIAGAVPGAVALVGNRDLRIVEEYTLPVSQTLVAPAGTTLFSARRVFSHPMALAQCRAFFAAHRHLRPVATFDTAGAVASVLLRGRATDAAIGSVRAAAIWGGAVIARSIQDRPDNETRFVRIVRRRPGARTS
jgi:prephenate dehydratase